jgi:hypothetical protein
MSIDFGPGRWEKAIETYKDWWEDKLDRPLIPVILEGKDPGRPEPKAPLLSQATSMDFTVSAKDLIDRIDFELSRKVFLGDAFPFFCMDCFGPGVVAAFLGADLNNSTGQIWFHPKKLLPINEIHFEYDPDNVWLNRIKEIYIEGMKRWHGQVLMGMTDLGGVLDIIASFRTSECLLMDLYDNPEEVKRLIWEVYDLWHRFYDELNEVLQPMNPGYCDWGQILSDKPSYTLQSDFSYMISPEMFDEFAKPELEASAKRLVNTMYHFDGIGQLSHLDSLLEIKEIGVVQFASGSGDMPDQSHWPEVHRKIQKAGKKMQIYYGLNCLDKIIVQIGTHKGIHLTAAHGDISEKEAFINRLKKYGIE